MHFIKAKAVKLIDNSSYPEIILCEFVDVAGYKHEFIEKWPVLSDERFVGVFPKNCTIGCVTIQEKALSYVVSTLEPWGIVSTTGKSTFEINKELLIEIEK